MKKFPLVSVIITTKNEQENIKDCLKSLFTQTYKNLEVIVVDNNSTDKTKSISKKFTKKVFNVGPERSVQRNYGAKISKGVYLLFLDADMRLTKDVIQECVDLAEAEKCGGIVIPEVSYGTSFWARCKNLERKFYLGIDWIEAARFYPKYIFSNVGGFDTELNGPEDWDLSQRVGSEYKIYRINSFIKHNEGNLSLFETISKKYYYSKKITGYRNKSVNVHNFKYQSNLFLRYKLFLSNPKFLFEDPVLGIGMLFMKTMEFAGGLVGYIVAMKVSY